MDEENKSEEIKPEENKPQEESIQNKNMNPLIIGVVVAVLAVAVGFFLLAKNASKNSQLSESANQNQTEGIAPVQSSPASENMENESVAQNTYQITVEGGGFYFKPNEIRVKIGQKVTIEFKNAGGMHDFVIDELNVKSKLTNTGETAIVEFTPTQSGEFEFYCSVVNHRQQGMKGTLIVE